jgi:hypothetical protein
MDSGLTHFVVPRNDRGEILIQFSNSPAMFACASFAISVGTDF